MNLKVFFQALSDMTMPKPRTQCPHCGGVRCIGLCGAEDAASRRRTDTQPPTAEDAPADKKTRG